MRLYPILFLLLLSLAPLFAACSNGPIEITFPSPTVPSPRTVYITGEVAQPGVYTLPPEADRVSDAIEAGGGFTEDADLNAINLAAKLFDGQHIQVPALGASSAAEANASSLININTASLELLQTLPGIGITKARAITEYREASGPFKRIEDIIQVPGIGEGIFESIRDLITVQ